MMDVSKRVVVLVDECGDERMLTVHATWEHAIATARDIAAEYNDYDDGAAEVERVRQELEALPSYKHGFVEYGDRVFLNFTVAYVEG